MKMYRFLAAIALVLAVPATALGGMAAPTPLTPGEGTSFQYIPSFGWRAVAGADHYAFQIAADSGFDAPVDVGGATAQETWNTWGSIKTALPNGRYWWRVRGVDAKGKVGPWSTPRSFRKAWVGQTIPLAPADGATIAYPTAPTLKWQPIEGAAKYEVTFASAPDLSNLDGGPAYVIETDASAFSVTSGLSASTSYYWSVVPIDGAGNRGTGSDVWSFTWQWPTTTTLTYEDLAPADDVVDPRFSWTPVPGAARYEVEINADAQFAAGSKFCCDDPTVSTVFSPRTVLLNNRYYWRVRAIDPSGNFGSWNAWSDPNGPDDWFRKTFDTRDAGDPNPSIQNLRMVDNLSDVAGTDFDGNPGTGYQTQVPIVTWDPLLGATAYEVEVRFHNGGGCTSSDTGQYWNNIVATNAWTPLGPNPSENPWPNHGRALGTDGSKHLVDGNRYCVRVRALTDKGFDANGILHNVTGDWTYLDDGWSVDKTSFQFIGYPDDTACTDVNPPYTCSVTAPVAGTYIAPTHGSTTDQTPYFTWHPTPNAQGYFVLVSRDPNFTTVIDYAWVRGPAYAPRLSNSAVSYADETTAYYWVILPAAYTSGRNALLDPLAAAARSFEKESAAPQKLTPTHGQVFPNRPTFRWTLAHWARTYTLQVATDPLFSDLVEEVETASTSYTPQSSYPADRDLYWRVRANDWNEIGLTWSSSATFQVTLPAPVPSSSNVASSELIPTWNWSPVQGAVTYDFELQQPDGVKKLFKGYRSAAVTFLKLDGTGIWHWKVRANFPTTSPTQVVPGPWSAIAQFRNEMAAPTGLETPSNGAGAVFRWSPKLGAASYRVEVSTRQDFSGAKVESVKTENPTYAPVLKQTAYKKGGTLYWRVAAIDERGNIGEMTKALTFRLPPQLKVSVSGLPRRGKSSTLTINVTDADRGAIRGAKISITGAGVRRKGLTKGTGKALVKVRPLRPGKLTITVTKKGYRVAVIVINVR
jgi:large repetitive protein